MEGGGGGLWPQGVVDGRACGPEGIVAGTDTLVLWPEQERSVDGTSPAETRSPRPCGYSLDLLLRVVWSHRTDGR